jgi:hypothetical protein
MAAAAAVSADLSTPVPYVRIAPEDKHNVSDADLQRLGLVAAVVACNGSKWPAVGASARGRVASGLICTEEHRASFRVGISS